MGISYRSQQYIEAPRDQRQDEKTPLFSKHPKRCISCRFDHLHHANIPYTHKLVVCPFFDVAPFDSVAAFVFADEYRPLDARTRMLTTQRGGVGHGHTALHLRYEAGTTSTASSLERMPCGRTVRQPGSPRCARRQQAASAATRKGVPAQS